MNLCLSTLVELDAEGYSAAALRRLADGRKFPTKLTATRKDLIQSRDTTVTQMSISGVQDKFSLALTRGQLIVVEQGGEYILKPIPGTELPRFGNEVPANEHVTMQLASQVYGIQVAPNALIRFADDELAYITRRFDRRVDGKRIAQEDFAQLLETSEHDGRNYKYDKSYEEIAGAIDRFCAANLLAKERFFRQLVFCYLVGNGDAHLKNFSVTMTSDGDRVFAPAYDLLCTKIHIPKETPMALDLLANDELTDGETSAGFWTGSDLLSFASRIGLIEKRAARIIESMQWTEKAEALLGASFLTRDAKSAFRDVVSFRAKMLAT